MNEKIPQWLNVSLIVAIIVLFLCGAVKSLGQPNSSTTAQEVVGYSTPAGLLLAFFVMLKVFLAYDLATFMSLILIIASLVIFYFGLLEVDKVKENAMLTFAGALFGLGSGMPIGKALPRIRGPGNSVFRRHLTKEKE